MINLIGEVDHEAVTASDQLGDIAAATPLLRQNYTSHTRWCNQREGCEELGPFSHEGFG
jgi:hypothetical protein